MRSSVLPRPWCSGRWPFLQTRHHASRACQQNSCATADRREPHRRRQMSLQVA